ncbi:MAG: hypothetical protein ACKO3R_02090 [bacterium]
MKFFITDCQVIPFWKILLSPSSPKPGLRKGHIKVFFRLKWYFGIIPRSGSKNAKNSIFQRIA